MLNNNFASVSAQIARANAPYISPKKQDNLVEAIRQGANDYYTYDAIRRNNAEQDRMNVLSQNLAKALESGDEKAINDAYYAYNPQGAYETLMKIKQAKEQSDLDFARQKELLGLQNKYALALQDAKNKGNNSLVNISMNNPFDKKRIEKIASNIDENISASQSKINDYKRMEQLLEDPDVSTGGVVGAIKDNIPTALLNEKEQELQSIISKIVPQMRPTGSGSTSDKDIEIFKKAAVGLNKSKDANLNLVRAGIAGEENSIAQEELRADWINQGGSLTEFDKQWRKYREANPIFSSENGDLNQNRLTAYDWFSGKRNVPEKNQTQDNDPLGIL